MSQFSREELRDMAPAFVLGALSADEHAAFESALKTSNDLAHELAHEVAAFRAVTERIAGEQQLAPPPALRARFLDNISASKASAIPLADSQPASAPANANAPANVNAPARPFTVSTGNASAPRTPAPNRWWLPAALGTALAASLVFAVTQKNEASKLGAQLAQKDSAYKHDLAHLSQHDTTLESILEAESGLIVVHLAGADKTGPGIQVMWNLKQGRGVLHAFRLKPAASGRAYQLWLIKDGKPVPSQVFNSDPDGHSLVRVATMPGETSGVTALAITEEPASGSPQPTTKPFLVGALSKSGL